MYQKEIIYMSLYSDDVKEGCVGYLKSEERQGIFRLELQIKNIQKATAEKCPIRLQGTAGWHEAGRLMLQEGNGKWTGSSAEPVLRVEIILSDISIIKGQSKNVSASEEQETKQVMAEPEEIGLRMREKAEPDKSVSQLQFQSESGENELKAQVRTETDENRQIVQVRAEEGKIGQKRRDMAETMPIYESKWEQLLATYEKIHPYGDNRVYVKLEPKDFVILPSGYQHLVNNSFLLHGFYNYRYLILGKEKDFYLGVPGVFYEREKMVALMFGFEAFECEGGNAQEGKFGYYLRKVEL